MQRASVVHNLGEGARRHPDKNTQKSEREEKVTALNAIFKRHTVRAHTHTCTPDITSSVIQQHH